MVPYVNYYISKGVPASNSEFWVSTWTVADISLQLTEQDPSTPNH